MKMHYRPLLVACALTAACSSDDKVSIGEDGTDLGALAAPSFAGDWDGYIELYWFGDRSDRIRLKLDAQLNGTFETGDSPHPPAPMNADDPPVPADSGGSTVVGFPYTVEDAKQQMKRLTFTIDPVETLAAWCALQTPVSKEGGWSIVPDGPVPEPPGCLPNGIGGESVPYCTKVYYSGSCRCTQDGCTSVAGSPMYFDGTLVGQNDMSGTFVLSWGNPGSMVSFPFHLTRQ